MVNLSFLGARAYISCTLVQERRFHFILPNFGWLEQAQCAYWAITRGRSQASGRETGIADRWHPKPSAGTCPRCRLIGQRRDEQIQDETW